jgi:hypothetical protein
MNLIPPRTDRAPLFYFIAQMLVLSVGAAWLPLIVRAAYLAWVIIGVAILVQVKVVPALPMTFGGNVMRILKAHAWPLYLLTRS